ncbi:MAG: DLW-39 family protein [Propionibacteriaceae bacterium]
MKIRLLVGLAAVVGGLAVLTRRRQQRTRDGAARWAAATDPVASHR